LYSSEICQLVIKQAVINTCTGIKICLYRANLAYYYKKQGPMKKELWCYKIYKHISKKQSSKGNL